jgi:hypothetical protein
MDDDLADRVKGPLQKIIGTEGMSFNHGQTWREQRRYTVKQDQVQTCHSWGAIHQFLRIILNSDS